jgi:hypothetical protein
VVLARCLERFDTVELAFSTYQMVRGERGNNVARWSLEEGSALQDPTIANKGAAGYGLLEYNPATATL